MKRLVAGASLLLLAGLGTFGWLRLRPGTPPSLLLVTIDTLRADRVGAYGSTAGLTPALDGLAARGWVFEHAVSAVPLTLPSHATILSGLDPPHHGVRNNGVYVFPAGRETLATQLKAAGYRTGAFVAAVVLDRRFGLARGFDVYDDRIVRASEGRSVLESERPCGEVTDRAINWIQSQTGPFFAWVHIYEPHAPYVPPADLAKAHPGHPYDAEVAAADRCLARVVAAAEAARPGGVVTAVTSDHGEALGDHGESTHGFFVYQSTLDVPMVVAGQGVPEGKRTGGLTRSADLAPTLLGLLGRPPLPRVDGRDLAQSPPGREAYAESDYPTGFGWAPLRAVRLSDLKFIAAPVGELYDLAQDPQELNNLAEARPDDVTRLQAVLGAILATEARADTTKAPSGTEERLRSLGYVAGAAPELRPSDQALDPKRALPLYLAYERSMAAEARGDFAASVRELRSLTLQDPRNPLFHRSLATALTRDGKADEALSVLVAAGRLAPGDPALSHALAVALAERGRLEEAIEADTRVLGLDPDHVDALDHLSGLYATQGDLDAARPLAEKAVARDENNPRAWNNLGNIARAQGRVDEAERAYRRAMALDPDLLDSLNGLGVLAVEQGRLDEAAGRFEQILGRDRSFDEARLNLAVVEAQRGHIARALRLANEVGSATTDPSLRTRARDFAAQLGTARN